jgi:hypothetical protein
MKLLIAFFIYQKVFREWWDLQVREARVEIMENQVYKHIEIEIKWINKTFWSLKTSNLNKFKVKSLYNLKKVESKYNKFWICSYIFQIDNYNEFSWKGPPGERGSPGPPGMKCKIKWIYYSIK